MSNKDWDFFPEYELTCKCGCGRADMQPDFMEKLVALRRACHFPFVLTSAFRCTEYNLAIGGARNSMHIHGRAVDVALSGSKAMVVLEKARQFGINGIGIKQIKGERFLHIDDRDGAFVLFTYR